MRKTMKISISKIITCMSVGIILSGQVRGAEKYWGMGDDYGFFSESHSKKENKITYDDIQRTCSKSGNPQVLLEKFGEEHSVVELLLSTITMSSGGRGLPRPYSIWEILLGGYGYDTIYSLPGEGPLRGPTGPVFLKHITNFSKGLKYFCSILQKKASEQEILKLLTAEEVLRESLGEARACVIDLIKDLKLPDRIKVIEKNTSSGYPGYFLPVGRRHIEEELFLPMLHLFFDQDEASKIFKEAKNLEATKESGDVNKYLEKIFERMKEKAAKGTEGQLRTQRAALEQVRKEMEQLRLREKELAAEVERLEKAQQEEEQAEVKKSKSAEKPAALPARQRPRHVAPGGPEIELPEEPSPLQPPQLPLPAIPSDIKKDTPQSGAKVAETWTCPNCTVVNQSIASKCGLCGAQKPQ